MQTWWERLASFSSMFLRFALGLSFLSAVADRFGLLLRACWQTRITALCSGMLLMTFSLAMTVALGMKVPLNFSVFSAAGGSWLLATCPALPLSLDELRRTTSR